MRPGILAAARQGAGVTAALAALSCLAGLLLGGVVLPAAGVIGIAARDAARTFSALPVPALGQLPSRSAILDSSGRLLAWYYPGSIDRVPVSYRQIAPVMRAATVAIEDARFWQHGALDLRGTLRALLSDLSGGSVQGGSTLAQQYVKNALLLTATSGAQQRAAVTDSAARKIRELRMAAQIEHQMSRPELLAAYLSVAYFAHQAYGVQAAAERYFSTTARRLDLAQAALLAGLVENPAGYDPVRYPAAALARRDVVLARMARLGYITAGRAAAARRSPLGLRMSGQAQGGCAGGAAAAWFCSYVLAVMRTDPAYAAAYRVMATTGGLTIRTTMSEKDQRAAQHAVSFLLPPPPSPYNPGGNAAAEVLIQPGTGRIRAIAVDRRYGQSRALGQDSIDYAADTRDDGGLGVQTGSSSKLFTLLAAAAYATVAARGIYCRPIAISSITAAGGQPLPVRPAGCHRVIPALVADAATHILQGVLTTGTAAGDGVRLDGAYIPQAGKTGTANGFQFAAFGGYTPRLAGYVSMFNPAGPASHPMTGASSCYRAASGALDCPGAVYGANAGQIWQATFDRASLGSMPASFVPVPAGSRYFARGPGTGAAARARWHRG